MMASVCAVSVLAGDVSAMDPFDGRFRMRFADPRRLDHTRRGHLCYFASAHQPWRQRQERQRDERDPARCERHETEEARMLVRSGSLFFFIASEYQPDS